MSHWLHFVRCQSHRLHLGGVFDITMDSGQLCMLGALAFICSILLRSCYDTGFTHTTSLLRHTTPLPTSAFERANRRIFPLEVICRFAAHCFLPMCISFSALCMSHDTSFRGSGFPSHSFDCCGCGERKAAWFYLPT